MYITILIGRKISRTTADFVTSIQQNSPTEKNATSATVDDVTYSLALFLRACRAPHKWIKQCLQSWVPQLQCWDLRYSIVVVDSQDVGICYSNDIGKEKGGGWQEEPCLVVLLFHYLTGIDVIPTDNITGYQKVITWILKLKILSLLWKRQISKNLWEFGFGY